MVLERTEGNGAELPDSTRIQGDENADRGRSGERRRGSAFPRAERIADLARNLIDAQRERKAWSSGRWSARNPKAAVVNPFADGTVEHRAWQEGDTYERALQLQIRDW